jgi:hypothetical protein
MERSHPILQRTFDIPDALRSLQPHAVWHSPDGTWESLVWESPDIQKPTLKEVQNEVKRLQKEWDKTEYRRWRAVSYPLLEEQLDALYHAGVFPPEMAAKIAAVKAKYPKPTEQ